MHSTKRAILVNVAACLIAVPGAAFACGGFFCNLASPVDQVGEQILFAVEGNEVTAHIQIAFKGAASDFSWVVPLPGLPVLSVGSDQVFAALRAQTDPKFEIDWQNDESCTYTNGCDCALESGGGSDGADGGGGVAIGRCTERINSLTACVRSFQI